MVIVINILDNTSIVVIVIIIVIIVVIIIIIEIRLSIVLCTCIMYQSCASLNKYDGDVCVCFHLVTESQSWLQRLDL